MLKYFVGLLAWMWGASAIAAGIQVAPTHLELTPREPIATVVISNPNPTPLLIQAQIWDPEKDLPTQALVALPSSFLIPGGEKQTIRVAWQSFPPEEAFYRLYLTEIPLKNDNPVEIGLKIALQLRLPIVVKLVQNEKKGH